MASQELDEDVAVTRAAAVRVGEARAALRADSDAQARWRIKVPFLLGLRRIAQREREEREAGGPRAGEPPGPSTQLAAHLEAILPLLHVPPLPEPWISVLNEEDSGNLDTRQVQSVHPVDLEVGTLPPEDLDTTDSHCTAFSGGSP